MSARKLTKETLKRLVRSEMQKLDETLELGLSHPEEVSKRVKEVDAAKYASTVEQCMDYYKLCKLKEAKLIRDLKRIQEAKKQLKQKLLANLD